MIRSILFQIAYYVVSVAYVFMAALSMVLPGKLTTRWIVQRYARRMLGAMRLFAGIRVEHRGLGGLPEGAFILAPKHQSWGDGFASFGAVDNLVFVTGNHLEKIPLLRGILARIGAIVVDNCGGGTAKDDLSRGARLAFQDGRRILIYPEGHLSKPGTHHRYRPGIWHLYHEHGVPVVPAGTNLGLYWQQTDFRKKPGVALVEYMRPIPPGLGKEEFMARLEHDIESCTRRLTAEALERDPGDSLLVQFKGEVG